MAARKGGLGRGLGALIPQGSSPVPARSPGKKTTAAKKAAVTKKPAAKKAAVTKKAAPKKAAAKKSGVKKSPEKKILGKKSAAKKSVARKSPAKKSAVKKSPAKKPSATKPLATQPARKKSTPARTSTAARPASRTSGSALPISGSLGGGLVSGAYFAEIPVAAIRPNPRQPRTIFDPQDLAELVASIREVGLLQPVVVRPLGADRFELVMGERRWRAHQTAGLSRIPAIVRRTEDADLLRDALLENLHRSQLNALEEAAAYQQLLDDFACTHEELAERIGRSRPQITNMIRLLKLPPAVQSKVAAGVLSAGHARALLGLEDPQQQLAMAEKIIKEGLSVRGVEELIALGRPIRATRKGSQARAAGPDLGELQERVADALDTKVTMSASAKGRGRIAVEFATFEDLRRIVGVIAPQRPAQY
ncbi:MAG TPA: chromosome partitioning protein ParB [Actinobacteria bacterium]|nr:chromosome partitioning protein ParB [Actinomycetota bacterium]